MQIEIKIEDVTREMIVDAAAAKVLGVEDDASHYRREYEQELRARIERQLEEAIATQVAALVDDSVRARIALEVDRVLTNGWPITDEYGRDSGQRRTLSSIVLDALAQQTPDRFGHNRPEAIPVMVTREVLHRRLGAEFEKEVAAAREAFRAQVDETIRGKISDILRNALGMR